MEKLKYSTVLEWFEGIDNKKGCIFIKFDIREFYSSILKKEYHPIPDEDVRVIDDCRKSLLFYDNKP